MQINQDSNHLTPFLTIHVFIASKFNSSRPIGFMTKSPPFMLSKDLIERTAE